MKTYDLWMCLTGQVLGLCSKFSQYVLHLNAEYTGLNKQNSWA